LNPKPNDNRWSGAAVSLRKQEGKSGPSIQKIIGKGFWEERGFIHVNFLPREKQHTLTATETL